MQHLTFCCLEKLLHDIKLHYEQEDSGPRWRLVDGEADITQVKEKEAKGMLTWRQPNVECRICGFQLPGSRQGMETHIKDTHS
jgi:hypothetical protein